MDQSAPSSGPSASISDLNCIRDDLQTPTYVMAHIAYAAGAQVISIRPGGIEFRRSASDPHFQMVIRQENIFALEALAYRRANLPVPQQVLDDLVRWNREHGREL